MLKTHIIAGRKIKGVCCRHGVSFVKCLLNDDYYRKVKKQVNTRYSEPDGISDSV